MSIPALSIPAVQHPIVLADWTFHGERYQCWNNNERMWIVHQRKDDESWELVSQW